VSNEQGTPPPPGNPSGEELLKFPTDYPIKVVGRPSAEFRARIHAVVLKHVPNVEADRITERLSENGNFLSISYTIVAESREQVVALARDLAAAEGVLMVI
jgi:uncharacterized protein